MTEPRKHSITFIKKDLQRSAREIHELRMWFSLHHSDKNEDVRARLDDAFRYLMQVTDALDRALIQYARADKE